MAAKLRVTLVRSVVSHTRRTRSTVRALGLHRIGETVEVDDTPPMRGMTRAVRFLLSTQEVGGASAMAAIEKPTQAAPAPMPTKTAPAEKPAAETAAASKPTAQKPAAAKPAVAKSSAAKSAPPKATAKAPPRTRAKKEASQS